MLYYWQQPAAVLRWSAVVAPLAAGVFLWAIVAFLRRSTATPQAS